MRGRHFLPRWGGGFLFSLCFIWCVAAVFDNLVPPLTLDTQLGKYVRIPGTVLQWRTEGWSDTRLGAHGLTALGERTLRTPGSKFILWGDSHVEALQVDDGKRTANVFNAMPGRHKALAVAGGGLSFADYYFDLPLYERLCPEINGHIFLISGMNDVLPDMDYACHAKFYSGPMRFVPQDCAINPRGLRWGPPLYQARLHFLFAPYYAVKDHVFLFRPGPMPTPSKTGKPRSEPVVQQGWTFLLDSLQRQTHGFLAFVYIPTIPRMEHGRVNRIDGDATLKEAFRKRCEERGVGFIDMTDAFVRLQSETGRFPRGFFNSPPGTGHLNEDGHRLIAEALLEYLARKGQ